jgi:hypothetical protein
MDNHSQAEGHERCPRCGGRMERGKKHRCKSAHDSGGDDGENGQKSSPSEDAIRERAYELYVARGRTPGHDVEDWMQAKRELTGGGRHGQTH